MSRDDIIALLDEDDEVIFFEPAYFDEAILGLTSTSPGWPIKPRVCYSSQKIVDILMRELDCAYDEALDYFGFNIQRFYTTEPPPPLLITDWT